ncbi:hypothetical protein GIB67_024759 [Kingdonia uniflora]|uniref:Pentatricopeptide repeat-containing protein n=1 Tax=Kingdonia uniflora TaxID=39325 RepID=A0A7J7NA44_9MAGN|nr:hypothetical protein GIB67_024759 [Kingdonia uniflora]
MYSNYGDLGSVYRVFKILQEKDIISWNSMIAVYAERCDFMSAITIYLQIQHREGIKAVRCFEAMKELGGALDPDKATFSAVLTACSHAGLVDEGHRIFSLTVEEYCVEPGIE